MCNVQSACHQRWCYVHKNICVASFVSVKLMRSLEPAFALLSPQIEDSAKAIDSFLNMKIYHSEWAYGSDWKSLKCAMNRHWMGPVSRESINIWIALRPLFDVTRYANKSHTKSMEAHTARVENGMEKKMAASHRVIMNSVKFLFREVTRHKKSRTLRPTVPSSQHGIILMKIEQPHWIIISAMRKCIKVFFQKRKKQKRTPPFRIPFLCAHLCAEWKYVFMILSSVLEFLHQFSFSLNWTPPQKRFHVIIRSFKWILKLV